MSNIKFGVCDQALPGAGIFAPRIAHEMGFDGMSIEMGTNFHGYPVWQKKIQEYYLDEQQKYGIEYANIAMSDLDFNPIHSKSGTPTYDHVRKMLKNAVDTAAAMKISTIMVCCFEKSLIRTDDELERAAKMMQYACDLAGEKGVTIGWETQLNNEKSRHLLSLVGRKNIGIFYDSQNYLFDGMLDQPTILEELYDILIPMIHVKDGNEKQKSSALLGTGNTKFYEQVEIFKKHNFKGWVISENYYDRAPLRDLNEDWFVTLKKDLEIMKNAFNW
jgi:sugar phosphate isomerase/epimerase